MTAAIGGLRMLTRILHKDFLLPVTVKYSCTERSLSNWGMKRGHPPVADRGVLWARMACALSPKIGGFRGF